MNHYCFHNVCGSNIELSQENRSAERLQAKSDFNNGLTFSDTTLETNLIFQIKITKKVGSWSGSIELGVTTINPYELTPQTLPQSAIELRNETWLMSGCTIIKNGEALIENYGFDLEALEEGDTVGLMRTSQGSLVFFINGTSQGVGATNVPEDVYVICNLYGKCAKVIIVDVDPSQQGSNTVEACSLTHASFSSSSNENNSSSDIGLINNSKISGEERIRFHNRHGPLAAISANGRGGERLRPLEEFNNAVLLTHRPLRVQELFQVRIDKLIQKWSGSIEFGLVSVDPCIFEFPPTLTIMRSGTVIMSGNGILHDGKATNSPYNNFNLDQLMEGDRIGIMLSSTGEVHYFVNGKDEGVATTGINTPVWGAINLYGMAAKVTIVDRNEREEFNLRLNNGRGNGYASNSGSSVSGGNENNPLLFHPNCGFHAAVINNGRTAHRPNARDDFNHGVVLTTRPLKSNELFEVQLERIVTKWAGSIEIGVTTHTPTQLDFPCTMTNIRSGTWMMTGNGIMHNGALIFEEYGQSLDRLKVNDCVGVERRENGNLHFYVNGVDQGCAATDVPSDVYGVIDLYGQAAEATIVQPPLLQPSPSTLQLKPDNNFKISSNELIEDKNIGGDLRFHALCGKNSRISNGGLTASRPNALSEFNAAIVMSNRPLRDNELFEVVIERMVDRWSGNIEAGVTAIRPEDLDFPNTMTDVNTQTFMLSGPIVHINGEALGGRYNCNLDLFTCGSRIGMMRKSNGNLHYYANGVDQGCAASDVPPNVYGVVDLYGQCAQVSLSFPTELSLLSSQLIESLSLVPTHLDSSHRFSNMCGKNILLSSSNLVASKIRSFSNGLVFSSAPLEPDEFFEVSIGELKREFGGGLLLGLTSLNPHSEYLNNSTLSSSLASLFSSHSSDTWWVGFGGTIVKNGVILKRNFCPDLRRLALGDSVSVGASRKREMRLKINGEDYGGLGLNLPPKVWAVFELFGPIETISVTSSILNKLPLSTESKPEWSIDEIIPIETEREH